MRARKAHQNSSGDQVMGIFGALTTAVTGLRAQSFALENVSGNIANSQTTAFKRMDTSFVDLIPDEIPSKQLSGSVAANSRMTNTVQGDIQGSSIGTFMAINGDGFFVVGKPSSFTDNQPVFDGTNLYTRRGDFQPDKNGFLVNGSGYYLMGIPVDPTTGNLAGSVPQLLQFQNDFLPAQVTTQIEYRANLASYPKTANADTAIPKSELLDPASFSANPIAGAPVAAKIQGVGAQLADVIATVSGTGTFANPATTTLGAAAAGTLAITVTPSGGAPTTYNVALVAADTLNTIIGKINGTAGLSTAVVASIDTTGGTNKLMLTSSSADYDFTIDPTSTDATSTALGLAEGVAHTSSNLIAKGVSQGEVLTVTVGASTFPITFGTGGGQVSTVAELNAALAGYPPAMGTAAVDANGNLTFTASGNNTVSVSPTTTATKFGITVFTAQPANGTVLGQDVSTFLDQSISGGAVTGFDVSGTPVNIQLRWAKVASSLYGGTDTWNLFYQNSSTATGLQSAWTNAGVNYTFGPNGQMNPTIANVTLANLTVDGVTIGDVQLVHGSGGITQFADASGNAKVNLLQQNGFPAGELQQISVSDKGRIVGAYSNGRTLDLAEISLVSFNGANYLKRIDGGAFQVTDESGPAILGASGKIVGSSLEGSNTDIADEFTKLIVTQQAYSANTRVISTSNQMVQDLLNMLR
jgi:flagellar hook protein FlgE